MLSKLGQKSLVYVFSITRTVSSLIRDGRQSHELWWHSIIIMYTSNTRSNSHEYVVIMYDSYCNNFSVSLSFTGFLHEGGSPPMYFYRCHKINKKHSLTPIFLLSYVEYYRLLLHQTQFKILLIFLCFML